MPDSLQITVTKPDGTIVNVTGDITNATIVETPPPTSATPPVTTPPVTTPPVSSSAAPIIPTTAKTVDMLPITTWAQKHDPGTPGSATGSTTYPFTLNGATVRKFDFSLTAKGGEIYYALGISNNIGLLNLCYDAILESPDWSNIACLEQDLNWTGPKGDLTIIGQQLSEYSKTAELTGLVGTTKGWHPSNVAANPTVLSPNVPHSFRWFATTDGKGNVNYLGVELDGIYFPFTKNNKLSSYNATAKWGLNHIQMQLQFDGISASTVASTMYAHKLQMHAW